MISHSSFNPRNKERASILASRITPFYHGGKESFRLRLCKVIGGWNQHELALTSTICHLNISIQETSEQCDTTSVQACKREMTNFHVVVSKMAFNDRELISILAQYWVAVPFPLSQRQARMILCSTLLASATCCVGEFITIKEAIWAVRHDDILSWAFASRWYLTSIGRSFPTFVHIHSTFPVLFTILFYIISILYKIRAILLFPNFYSFIS